MMMSNEMKALTENYENAVNFDSDSEDEQEKLKDNILKVVVMGDTGCGKTSICTQLVKNTFTRKYVQTIGVDFYNKRLNMPNNTEIVLHVWDVGGQSVATTMLNNYLFNANAVIFVYDVTSSQSFENIVDWIQVTKKITNSQDNKIRMILVGNKTDLEHRRAVRVEKHSKLADSYAMSSHYVSAKTGDSVGLVFRQTVADIINITLTKNDLESDITVINAPVATPTDAELREVANSTQQPSSNTSAACSIQ
uniref:Ras-related protein Rab-28 n=1 Tax=Rhabditophanes sp. KR3021 TaxID=114890 RepID=A0AC35U4I3_9BILA